MSRTLGLVLVFGLAAMIVTPAAQQNVGSGSSLLEAAAQKATVEGDLPGAIKIYQSVVDRFRTTDHATAATALLRMAECYVKEGDGHAADVYARIVNEFPDVSVAAELARERLASDGPLSPSGPQPRLVCDDCGDDFASITADGRTMAFGDDRTRGVGVVAVQTLSNGKVRRMLAEPGDAGEVLVSPDSRQIAFNWQPPDDNAPVELRVMPDEAGAKSRVLIGSKDYDDLVPSAFSPDGRLLVQLGKSDRTWQLGWVSLADGTLSIIKSLEWRVSGDMHEVSLSPDGRFIAFSALAPGAPKPAGPNGPRTSVKPERHLYLLTADGRSETVLVGTAQHSTSPIWMDNARVLYTSDVSGTWDLWSVGVRDGKPAGSPALIKKALGESTAVGITRTGTYFFYEGHSGVYESSVARTSAASAGSPAAQAARAIDTVLGSRPTWSPDGRSIALIRRRPPEGDAVDVVVHNVDSGTERVYSHDGVSNYPSLWYGDGKALLQLVAESDHTQAWYRIDLGTGEFRKVATNRSDPSILTHFNVKTLAPDGRTIYFGTYIDDKQPQLDRIVALDVATGQYRVVLRLPYSHESLPKAAQEFSIAASPDGRSLAVATFDPKIELTHLSVVGVDGQGLRELTSPFSNSSLRNKLSWTSDSRSIVYSVAQNPQDDTHTFRVMRINVTGGQPEETGLTVAWLDSLDVRPDGSQVAYSTLSPVGGRQELWSLDVAAILRTARPTGGRR